MKTRKIILIAADVILLAVCIVQGILNSKDNAKTFVFTDEPDEIVIEKADESFAITKIDGNWFIGEEKYPANNGAVEVLAEAASSIRTLDKMGKLSNETIAARYELSEGKKITVTVKKDGKLLRTLAIGKESSTGTQGYASIDNGDDVYLTASSLKSTFDKSIEDLRNRTVYQFDKNDINQVSVAYTDGEFFSVGRTGDAENLVWTLSGAEGDVDAKAATDWFNSLATLSTTKWHGRNEELGGELESQMKIYFGSKLVTVDVYVILAEEENEKDFYYANCSETPYTFEIPSYSVQKFQKSVEDITK